MANAISTPMLSRRALVILGIVVLHIAGGYIINSGLAVKAVKAVFAPIETTLIEEIKEADDKPPPPPPKIEATPPPFVPPPDIVFDLPVERTQTTAITATTKKPVERPPPPPPPKVERTPPKPNPRRPLSEPDYPPQSKRLGEEGATILRLYIMEDGRVSEAQIATSSGFPRLDEAAVKHAKRSWRFLPATEGGKPVAAWHDFRVVWRIEK